MSCQTRRPRTARIRMFASRTIISAGCALPAAAQFLKLRHQFFLINIREGTGKTVRCFLQFGNMGCLRTLSTCRNVDTESFAAPSNSNWTVRFQETGDPFAKLAHADFDRSHGNAPHPYTYVYALANLPAICGIRVVGQLGEVDVGKKPNVLSALASGCGRRRSRQVGCADRL